MSDLSIQRIPAPQVLIIVRPYRAFQFSLHGNPASKYLYFMRNCPSCPSCFFDLQTTSSFKIQLVSSIPTTKKPAIVQNKKNLFLLFIDCQYAVPNRRKDYGDGEGFGSTTSGHFWLASRVPTGSVDLIPVEEFWLTSSR